MKKLNILVTACLGLLLFSSCQTDTWDNPMINKVSTFTLNTPALAGNVYDLASSTTIGLTGKQPEYGYTAPVTYYAQMSLTNKWNDATSTDADDATYYQMDGSSTSPKIDVLATEVDKGIMKLAKITDESMFTADKVQTVYVRLKATLGTTTDYDCYSNVVKLSVMPYFMSLKNHAPDFWYMTGAAMGDGNWGGYYDSFPLSLIDGYVYDKNTGAGEFAFTGYFLKENGFKLKYDPTSWAIQWGSTDGGIGGFVMNDGGSKDIKVPEDGYYTVTLNTKTNKMSVKAATVKPTSYTTISMIGFNEDWNTDIQMEHTMGPNSHAWVAQYTCKAATAFKFRANNDWGTNWGGATTTYGFLSGGGGNIPIQAGKYVIYFNDIDGFFMMVPQ